MPKLSTLPLHRWTAHTLVLLGLCGFVLGWVVTVALRTTSDINVILITVDTLRADHLGVYGYARPTSPNLDAFAKESVVFRNAFAQSPETNPSLSSIMTSYFPLETTVLSNHYVLPERAVTLAEILRGHGYRTGAVVSNFSLRRGSGFDQGFDTYDDRMDGWSWTTWKGMERLAPKLTQVAVDWLTHHAHEKHFLWVHYMDPHYPYVPPAPYNTMFARDPLGPDKWLAFNVDHTGRGGLDPAARLGDHHQFQFYLSQYDGEIRFFDQALGELFRQLRASGLMDRTLIVVAGDHGEGMGEHDFYFAHQEFLYQGLIHVPLIVRFPDRREAGRVMAYPVANVDILPTILDALGIEYAPTVRGRNLLSEEDRDILALTYYRGPKFALLAEGVKYLRYADHAEMYDTGLDPREETDLLKEAVPEDRVVAEGLGHRLKELVTEDRLGLGAPVEWNLDAEAARKLKALGYVQ